MKAGLQAWAPRALLEEGRSWSRAGSCQSPSQQVPPRHGDSERGLCSSLLQFPSRRFPKPSVPFCTGD